MNTNLAAAVSVSGDEPISSIVGVAIMNKAINSLLLLEIALIWDSSFKTKLVWLFEAS